MKEAEGFFGGEELSRMAIMRWTYSGCFMSMKASTVIDQRSLVQKGECWPAANEKLKAKSDPGYRTWLSNQICLEQF